MDPYGPNYHFDYHQQQQTYHENESDSLQLQQNTRQGGLAELLDQLLFLSEQTLDDAQSCKQALYGHRMKPALFSVLCQIKEKTVIAHRHVEHDDPPDPQVMRLDNMLIAEGVAGPEKGGGAAAASNASAATASGQPGETTIEHTDYRNKLAEIRSVYHQELEKYEQA